MHVSVIIARCEVAQAKNIDCAIAVQSHHVPGIGAELDALDDSVFRPDSKALKRSQVLRIIDSNATVFVGGGDQRASTVIGQLHHRTAVRWDLEWLHGTGLWSWW
jgi:hypothetical protein